MILFNKKSKFYILQIFGFHAEKDIFPKIQFWVIDNKTLNI